MGEEGYLGRVPNSYITLRSVEEADLPILRDERNQWSTRGNLEDCRVLTDGDQIKWFCGTGPNAIRIAECGGVAVGLARIKRRPISDCFTVGADVFSKHRGMGYGGGVFGAACVEAIKGGATMLDLWVFMDNVRAVTIYSKEGFAIDYSTPVMQFLRPINDGDAPTLRAYMRMTKAVR